MSIAEKKQHEQDNPYKEKHLFRGLFTVSETFIIKAKNMVADMAGIVLEKQLRDVS